MGNHKKLVMQLFQVIIYVRITRTDIDLSVDSK